MTEQQSSEHQLKYRSGLSIYPSQVTSIEIILGELLTAIPAKIIVLVDVSGQFVTSVGDAREIDTDALGSLIAGDLAASQEIARITGEFQNFQLVLREGERSHIILAEAGPFLTFMAQFSKEVPLGWARKLIQRSASEIGVIALQTPNDAQEYSDGLDQEDLPDLFNDALDDIWKG